MLSQGKLFQVVAVVLSASSIVSVPAPETPVTIVSDAIESLGLQATPCRNEIREEWRDYQIICAQFEDPFCEFNARWHDHMADLGFISVYNRLTIERLFPERRDKSFSVGKLAYVIGDYPLLVLTHEYDHVLLIAIAGSPAHGASTKQDLDALFPELHPVQAVHMLSGPLMSGHSWDRHAALVHMAEPEDPRRPSDRKTVETLVLAITVDKEGAVTGVRLHRPRDADEELADAAISAAWKWRFSPARFCGLPWPDWVFIQVKFLGQGE